MRSTWSIGSNHVTPRDSRNSWKGEVLGSGARREEVLRSPHPNTFDGSREKAVRAFACFGGDDGTGEGVPCPVFWNKERMIIFFSKGLTWPKDREVSPLLRLLDAESDFQAMCREGLAVHGRRTLVARRAQSVLLVLRLELQPRLAAFGVEPPRQGVRHTDCKQHLGRVYRLAAAITRPTIAEAGPPGIASRSRQTTTPRLVCCSLGAAFFLHPLLLCRQFDSAPTLVAGTQPALEARLACYHERSGKNLIKRSKEPGSETVVARGIRGTATRCHGGFEPPDSDVSWPWRPSLPGGHAV